MAFDFLDLGPRLFDLLETGPSTEDDERAASDRFMLLLADGKRCVQAKHLGRGKARFRLRRALGKLRELRDPVTMGFPILNGDYTGKGDPKNGIVMRAYGDREIVDWNIRRCKATRYEGRWIVAPLGADDQVPKKMGSDLIRSRMGWSQSLLEKVTLQLPHLTKKPGKRGDVEVWTLPFLALINDAKYPFLRDDQSIMVVLS